VRFWFGRHRFTIPAGILTVGLSSLAGAGVMVSKVGGQINAIHAHVSDVERQGDDAPRWHLSKGFASKHGYVVGDRDLASLKESVKATVVAGLRSALSDQRFELECRTRGRHTTCSLVGE